MRYLLLLYLPERPEPGTPEGDRFYASIRAFHQECGRRGVMRSARPLDNPETAVTVRQRSGQVLRTDGPFAETTEWLGGYFLLECEREEAHELAALCPDSRLGSVEVRPISDGSG